MYLLRRAQVDSFPAEIKELSSDKDVTSSSHLSCFSSIYENATGLIRVGGRFLKTAELEPEIPLCYTPTITKLPIKEYDNNLFHSGLERAFGELRWIYSGSSMEDRPALGTS